MMRPTRIGIFGAPATGKSSLLDRIEAQLGAQGLVVGRTSHPIEPTVDMGLPQWDAFDDISTEWTIHQGFANEVAAEARGVHVVLVDGTAHCAVTHYMATKDLRREQIDEATLRGFQSLAATRGYDLLMATELAPEATNSGSDSLASRYRLQVDRHTHDLRVALARRALDPFVVNGTKQATDAAIHRSVQVALRELAAA